MSDDIKDAKLSDLKPDLHNANKHTERGTYMLNQSVGKFGSREAGTVDKNGRIVGGNNRHTAYGDLGIENVQIIKADPNKPVFLQYDDLDLTDPDNPARELSVALNRSAQVGIEFDPETLAEYQLAEVDLGDWFKDDELSELLADIDTGSEGNDAEPETDRAEELRQQYGVELGQLWQLGEHRLICGDCTDPAVVERVMGGEKADIEIHDPPYGKRLDTDWSEARSSRDLAAKKGIFGGKKYKQVEGDHIDYDPTFLFKRSSKPKEVFLWGADYFAEKIPDRNNGSWIVWDKRLDESADRMYGSGFELCWSMVSHKQDIMRIKWCGVFGSEKEPDKKRSHPTQKPVLLYEWMLNRYSKDGDISADYYLGAGSHLIACENLNRRCRAIEIDPGYVAVSIHRWEQATGKTAELIG